MRFSVVYVEQSRQWAVIDRLASDEPIKYFSTEWAALNLARDEERRWQTRQLPYPKLPCAV